ncbi:uncharacterized protein LOC8078073 [Sorghum bicolor]|uniref:uncharacterized protein LOC8078073 n=1 Tax=Sorghum bicolor TaxID=4558 RepID=UPI000B426178|nr:uncharacterized protein LOC8078073 [Sorghum bicolor]|eukprot:XP_021313510.1 uncharacterized protein LOC8078073 [Sorghum bicolor]
MESLCSPNSSPDSTPPRDRPPPAASAPPRPPPAPPRDSDSAPPRDRPHHRGLRPPHRTTATLPRLQRDRRPDRPSASALRHPAGSRKDRHPARPRKQGQTDSAMNTPGLSSTASTGIESNEPTDLAWKYCTMPDVNKKGSLQCTFCSSIYHGGITRIKYHLGKVPKSNVAKCKKVPSDVQQEILEVLAIKSDNKQKKAEEKEEDRAVVDLSHSEGEEHSDAEGNSVIVVKKMSSKGHSGPIDKFCRLTTEEIVAARKGKGVLSEKVQSKISTEKREEKRDRACEYICKFFYDASIPHNVTTLPSFELMLEAIGDFGRGLRGPTPYEMSGKFLQKRKRKVQELVKAHKESWELHGCSVMTDVWTDKRGRGVMNLVVHSAYGVYFLDSVDCSAVKKDGRYIFELVDKCIEEIGVQNVVQVVTDNARPNEAAASLLRAKHPSIFWNGCAAHTIDLMLEDIGKMPRVAATISKAKCLTVFLYAHTRVLDLMRKYLSRDLVRCGVTRFATAYLNLKSMLENKKQLQRLFREEELHELGYLKSAKGKKAEKVAKSETFWRDVETAVNYFEPLAHVLRRMDSDVPAMGFLYGYLQEAKNEISKRFNNDRRKFEEVFQFIDKRWDSKLQTPLHRAGYYLNPFYYYQNKVAIEDNETFRDGVITCITKLVPDIETQDKIIEELQKLQDVEGSFGKEIAKRQCKNIHFDPAKWWLNHGSSAPTLRKLAAKILSLTCSSSACERCWSSFEQVHTKRRNRLLHDRMRDLVFVKLNSKLRQKKDNKDRDPLEKPVSDVLEDEDNEWITGVEQTEMEEDEEGGIGGTSQEVVAAPPPRKRGNQSRKRKRLIPTGDDELFASSSDGENDTMMHSDSISVSDEEMQ